MFKVIEYNKTSLTIINQTKLPTVEDYETYSDYIDMVDAIKKLKVRGAPLIGVMVAYGISVCLNNCELKSSHELIKYYQKIRDAFYKSRPTAKNLFYAIERIDDIIYKKNYSDVDEILKLVEKEAIEIHNCEIQSCLSIAQIAYDKIFKQKESYNFITHCNTGSLATGGLGTALGIIKYIHQQGGKVHVFVDETRPLLQGSRLTAYELQKEKIPYTVITDGMAAQIMATNSIDAVIVGADRITSMGDVANKIGTFNLAIVSNYFNVPFYVAAPVSTFDLSLKNGKEIVIEMRDDSEVTKFNGVEITPMKSKSMNFSFDVTPFELINAIITEKGVLSLPLNLI